LKEARTLNFFVQFGIFSHIITPVECVVDVTQ